MKRSAWERARGWGIGAWVILASVATSVSGGDRSVGPAASPESAPATTQAATAAVDGRRKAEPFILTDEKLFMSRLRASGQWTVIRANYLEAPLDTVVKSLAATQPAKVAVYQCLGPVREEMKALCLHSDLALVWMYRVSSMDGPRGPSAEDLIWPGYDNPLINRVRELRSISPGSLLAILAPKCWGISERGLSFNEFQWIMLSVIGARCDGILWAQDENFEELAWKDRLAKLEASLKAQADDLGRAAPVKWVQAPPGQPMMALCAEDKLFVVLLNRDYMAISKASGKIAVPVDPVDVEGQLTLQCPPGCRIKSATRLSGEVVEVVREQATTRVNYRFAGGGDLLILDLQRDPGNPTSAKITNDGAKNDGAKEAQQ